MFPLYLDEDSLARLLVRGLRAQGIDVLTTSEAGRRGNADEDQLAFAASQGRVLCTANVADFTRLHTQWMETGKHHAGMILVHQRRIPLSAQLNAFIRLVKARSVEEVQDGQMFLTNWVA